MGWLSKIFQGSKHKVKERHSHGRDGDADDADAEDQPTGFANEDIDRAIALSLSMEEGEESYIDDDEEFARVLQESLNLEFGQGDGHADQPSEESSASPLPYSRRSKGSSRPSRSRICAGCNNDIDRGHYLSFMGAFWHSECFNCHSCHQLIVENEFREHEGYPYHKSCYMELSRPRCDVCEQFIPSNENGVIEVWGHPFWPQKYCPSHRMDGTPRCCSCERLEGRNAEFVALDEGRKLCLECLESAVMDTSECEPLYLEIHDFFEGLNMKIVQQVPLLLVERQGLNEAIDREKSGHHKVPETETRGMCISEEQIVQKISRRPRLLGNKIMGMKTEPQKLIRQCEVTAILILYGLPRLTTGSILAHELMHAWLRLNGYDYLGPIEEGICQVLGHMWLDSEILPGSGSNIASSSSSSSASTSSKKGSRLSRFDAKLGEYCKYQIEKDTSAVYGDGFRAANRAVLKYGLRSTLAHMKLTGELPD